MESYKYVIVGGGPDDERKPMQALVKARPAYEGVADKLAAEEADLREVVEGLV